MTPENAYELILLALTIWREARGEVLDAKRGVACCVANRVAKPSWWGQDWVTVILKPFQFSSFNHDDPNAVKWPQQNDTSWLASLEIADEVYNGHTQDVTAGCTHYFDKSLDTHTPTWATDGSMVHVTDLGNLRFYRRA
jgi:N-acetylmuramoyl-L-alanine amidase